MHSAVLLSIFVVILATTTPSSAQSGSGGGLPWWFTRRPRTTTTRTPAPRTTTRATVPITTTRASGVTTTTRASGVTTTTRASGVTTTTRASGVTTTTRASGVTTTTRASGVTTTTRATGVTTTTTRLITTSNDVCAGLRAQRKEISDMSTTEWNNYVTALNGVRTSGVYATYINYHSQYAALAHGGCYFLPWHRQYLFEFERELNKIVPGVTIPFWDWTKVVSGTRINEAFANDPIWNSRMGGANGNGPIPRPPFAGWSAGGRTCVRDFFTGAGNVGGGGDRYFFISSEQVAALVNGRDAYADFTTFLEGQHNTPHVAIGGNMGIVATSPLDPMFWSHHSFIDMVWRNWQLSGNGNAFGGEQDGGSCSATSVTMPPFNRNVNQILTGISQCMTYARGSSAGPVARFSEMQGLSARQASSSSPSALTLASDSEKNSFLRTVAQKKQNSPSAYQAEVGKAILQVDTMERASRAFGMPGPKIARAVTFYRNLLLKQGIDVVGDASIMSKQTSTIVSEGRTQAASLQNSTTS